MKTILKFLIALLAFTGACFGQTLTNTVCAVAQPTCHYFGNADLEYIFKAIMTTGDGTTVVSSSSVVAGNVGGFTTKQTCTLTTDGLYASGDNVGGVKSFSNIIRVNQTTCILNDLEFFDNANQNANLIIDFYSATPSGTHTNNNPTVLSFDDSYLGTVLVSSADYVTTGTKSRATITGIGLVLKSPSIDTRTIYMTITTNGSTPTYPAGSTTYVKLGILQD